MSLSERIMGVFSRCSSPIACSLGMSAQDLQSWYASFVLRKSTEKLIEYCTPCAMPYSGWPLIL